MTAIGIEWRIPRPTYTKMAGPATVNAIKEKASAKDVLLGWPLFIRKEVS
jgi:hypothetical protein